MKNFKLIVILSIFFLNIGFAHAAKREYLENKIKEMGFTLPHVSPSTANYVESRRSGKLIFISGQLPIDHGNMSIIGKVGEKVTLAQAEEAAKLCALQILAQLKSNIGYLDRVSHCIKLTAYVNSTSAFAEHMQVVNAASNIIISVFGEKGKAVSTVVGVNSLPLNSPVLIEAIFEIK